MTSSSFETTLRRGLAFELLPSALAQLDEGVGARVAKPRPALPRLRRIGVVVAAAVVVVAGAVGVSASLRSTESPYGMESATAFQAEIDAAKQVVPLPAGDTWPWYVNVQDQSGSYSTGGGRSQVEGAAFCLWVQSWLDARTTGDTARLAAARNVIAQVPSWQMYTSVFADPSYRRVVDSVVSGVRRGDSTPVAAFAAANCVK